MTEKEQKALKVYFKSLGKGMTPSGVILAGLPVTFLSDKLFKYNIPPDDFAKHYAREIGFSGAHRIKYKPPFLDIRRPKNSIGINYVPKSSKGFFYGIVNQIRAGNIPTLAHELGHADIYRNMSKLHRKSSGKGLVRGILKYPYTLKSEFLASVKGIKAIKRFMKVNKIKGSKATMVKSLIGLVPAFGSYVGMSVLPVNTAIALPRAVSKFDKELNNYANSTNN